MLSLLFCLEAPRRSLCRHYRTQETSTLDANVADSDSEADLKEEFACIFGMPGQDDHDEKQEDADMADQLPLVWRMRFELVECIFYKLLLNELDSVKSV